MGSRWAQENFWKYIREEFGFDTLADHIREDVDGDEQVVNQHWRLSQNAVERWQV